MGDTGISWTHRPGTRGRTWNPIRGCSRVSEGCRHCYAEVQAARIVRMGKGKPTPYDGLVRLARIPASPASRLLDSTTEPRWTGEVVLDASKLAEPLRWRQPSTVFVNSMSDLFHEKLTNEQIAAVFGVMAACPQHTFQVLTKRARRMREWFEWLDGACMKLADFSGPWWRVLHCLAAAGNAMVDDGDGAPLAGGSGATWPLSNVWLGVSVENRDALHRLDDLRAIPAAVRMVSAEPLLEDLGTVDLRGIGWLIGGGESGPCARPIGVDAFRSLRDRCAAAGVPFFLKQASDAIAEVTTGHGSKRKPGGVIELPYLDGVQHAAFPGGTP